MVGNLRENFFGFEFDLCEVWENASTEDGEEANIFFLKIGNLTEDTRRINVSKATYVTKDREQLEQDIWLSGYLIVEGIIKAGAYRKSGHIFYKKHLNSVRIGDTLYIDVVIIDQHKKLSLKFVCSRDTLDHRKYQRYLKKWILAEYNTEDIEVKPTPKELSRMLTKRIERLEVIEERLGVLLDKLFVKVSEDYSDITITGEIHTRGGTTLNNDIEIAAIAYDHEGLVIETSAETFYSEDFYAFDVISIRLWSSEIGLETKRIRIFPKKD